MGLDVKVLSSQLPATPPGPRVTEEEWGTGILADLNWSHTIKISLSFYFVLQVQKLVMSFGYTHDIVFLFSFVLDYICCLAS